MEKENLPDDEHDNKDEVGEESEEFHGDITEEEIENVVETFDEDDEPDLQWMNYSMNLMKNQITMMNMKNNLILN